MRYSTYGVDLNYISSAYSPSSFGASCVLICIWENAAWQTYVAEINTPIWRFYKSFCKIQTSISCLVKSFGGAS